MDTATTMLLRQVPLFAGMDESLLQSLATHTRRRRFGANEALFHEGDPGYTLYLIVDGHVHIQTTASSGETVHIARRGPGEHFGELSLIDGKPRMADAVTAEPCELLMLDHAHFVRCIEQSPRIALSIMSCLADRIRQAADHLESHQELDVLGRVAHTILELAEAHGQAEAAGEIRIGSKVTQQQIAEQVGTTRESVNRALASLKSVGAIRFEGRQMIVLNANKLRQYLAR